MRYGLPPIGYGLNEYTSWEVCGTYCDHSDSTPSPRIRPADIARFSVRTYIIRNRLELPRDEMISRVVACPERGRRIAALYAAAPLIDHSKRTLDSYRAFERETSAQFDFLTKPTRSGGAGIRVETCSTDPYSNLAEMIEDLNTNRSLRVLATSSAGAGQCHPFLTNEHNDIFRAVHDIFGHASIGRGFDRHGEDAAWAMHSHVYTPLARLALATETRGQNAALIWQHNGQRFADQKVMTLPHQFTDPWQFSLRPGSAHTASHNPIAQDYILAK